MTPAETSAVPPLRAQWQVALQRVADKAAHEIKGALNGVALNLEVVRSRSSAAEGGKGEWGGSGVAGISDFAAGAADQLDLLTSRIEALLFIVRPHRASGPPDVAVTLKHLATLLVPAAKAERKTLEVSGIELPVPSAAPAEAIRLALASGLLALMEGKGTGRCALVRGSETVVRFSHEPARACSLDAAVAETVAANGIRLHGSGTDLQLSFPGS